MANKSNFPQVWLPLIIFVVVSSLAASVSMHFNEKFSRYVPETAINRSSLNKKASGTSGLYALTKSIGLESHLWKLPYRDLRDVKGQLVIIGPQESLSKFEIETIFAWVAKGNSLIYLDLFSNPYSQEILVPLNLVSHRAGPCSEVSLDPQTSLRVTRFVGLTKASYETALSPDKTSVPVLKHGQDIVLVESSHGKGRVLIGTTANLLSNVHLAGSGSNFQLIGNWLRLNNTPVYFDERCHGLTQGRNLITSLMNGPSGILLAQLLLLLGIAVAGSTQRFGQLRSQDNARKLSNLEFVNGIANSYQRAKATHLASEVLSHDLRLKLAKALGQSTGDDDTLAASYLDLQNGQERDVELARLIKTLRYSKPGAGNTLSNQELTEIAAYCDKIQETLDSKRHEEMSQ